MLNVVERASCELMLLAVRSKPRKHALESSGVTEDKSKKSSQHSHFKQHAVVTNRNAQQDSLLNSSQQVIREYASQVHVMRCGRGLHGMRGSCRLAWYRMCPRASSLRTRTTASCEL